MLSGYFVYVMNSMLIGLRQFMLYNRGKSWSFCFALQVIRSVLKFNNFFSLNSGERGEIERLRRIFKMGFNFKINSV